MWGNVHWWLYLYCLYHSFKHEVLHQQILPATAFLHNNESLFCSIIPEGAAKYTTSHNQVEVSLMPSAIKDGQVSQYKIILKALVTIFSLIVACHCGDQAKNTLIAVFPL